MSNKVRSRFGLAALLGVDSALGAEACASKSERQSRICTQLTNECIEGAVPSYTSQIAPFIQSRCGGCHTREDPAGQPFDDYEDVAD